MSIARLMQMARAGVPAGPNPFGFVGFSANNVQTITASITIDYPSGTGEGDLCVVVVGVDNSNDYIATPSGWTEIYRVLGTNNNIQYNCFAKNVTADDLSAGTLTISSSTTANRGLAEGTGVVMSNFGDGSVITSAGTQTLNTNGTPNPSAVTLSAGDISLVVYYIDDQNNSSATLSEWTTITNKYNATNISNDSGAGTAGAFYREITSGGSYNPGNIGTLQDRNATTHLALRSN